MTEESRETRITDCNELDGKDDEITKIEYISSEIAYTEIINIENPEYALVTYKGYIFKIDDKLNIIEEEEIYDEETLKYKKVIAQALTDLGVETSYKQPAKDYINNIKILEEKSYKEGKESDIVLLKTNLSSRYVQTVQLDKIDGFENFDEDDFIIGNRNMQIVNRYDGEEYFHITKSYNKQTGALTLGKQKDKVKKNSWSFWNNYDLYATKRKLERISTYNSTTNKKEILDDFKIKLTKALKEQYGIEEDKDNPLVEKTEEEISEYIKEIAKKKYKEGIATYIVLIQGDLSSRYNQTVSVTDIEGHENLTLDDFLIVNKCMNEVHVSDGEDILNMTKNYNADTGMLEFGKQKAFSADWTIYNTYDVYLLKKDVINLES